MKNIWLVGVGSMGIEYQKVLTRLNIPTQVIGRSQKNATEFKKITGHDVYVGGLSKFLKEKPLKPQAVIVAANIEEQYEILNSLINFGIKKILVEKPGCLLNWQLEKISKLSLKLKSDVFIAYNRRFYSSVLKAKNIIISDGGLSSFYFDFTEWSDKIRQLDKKKTVKSNWFYLNSSHVLDLAFFLGGYPKQMTCYTSGSLDWHPKASKFNGSGITEAGVQFSYKADWNSAGRWGVELFTSKHRLILQPLEKLFIQNKNSLEINEVKTKDKNDIDFKPGLYLQTKAFLTENYDELITIQKHYKNSINYYEKILSGSK